MKTNEYNGAYKSNQQYTKSPEWKNIRNIILERDDHKCTKCPKTENLHVHHLTYDNLYNELEHLEDLITLCPGCHITTHNNERKRERIKKINEKERIRQHIKEVYNNYLTNKN